VQRSKSTGSHATEEYIAAACHTFVRHEYAHPKCTQIILAGDLETGEGTQGVLQEHENRLQACTVTDAFKFYHGDLEHIRQSERETLKLRANICQ
jgi:hypothetical protein